MPKIHVTVQNKIARASRRDGCIVCANSDYAIVFSFDSEWDEHAQKTARFIWNGRYFDQTFTGDTCPVPMIVSAPSVEVGVYAGELRTTTSAFIRCRPSIRSDTLVEAAPEAVEQYNNQAQAAAAQAEAAAQRAQELVSDTQSGVMQAQGSASEALSLATQAKETASGAETTAAMAMQYASNTQSRMSVLENDTFHAVSLAKDLIEHNAAYVMRYMFTVGQPDEQTYLTPDSTGIYTVSGAYRYNNNDNVTVYRYPLTSSADIESAVWHAHLAQQTLLQASVDGVNWITLYDTHGEQLGFQYRFELCHYLSLADATALYIKISDSNPADGMGGAILADIPVTLDLVYGVRMPFLLPVVGPLEEGSYLRVIDGQWQLADATSLTSRVRTYSFRVGEDSEQKYLHSSSCSHTNTTCRFNDEHRCTVYQYHVANAALVRRVLWTATLGQQLKLECSADGESWSVIYDAGTERIPFTRMTFDLTDRLNLLAFDEIYIRISDSSPTDGFGGAIQKDVNVDLHLERCEPPIYFN